MNRTLSSILDGQRRGCSEQRNVCNRCAVHDKAICGALGSEEAALLNQISRRRRLMPDQRILTDQASAENFAIIVSGTVKLTMSLLDGRQQIVGLLFPSDFVGRPFASRSSYRAEAATEVLLCSFPTGPFEKLIQQYPGVEHRLFQHALEQLDVAQDWMLLLGRKTALEKVSTLLVMIASRTRDAAQSESNPVAPIRFEMPLSRNATADYLGLTLETVSRQFRILKSSGAIRLDGTRNITILDQAKLDAAATRPLG